MHRSLQPRLTWIARLALGIALFALFAAAANACLLPQRSPANAHPVASVVDEDQQHPCSGAGCAAQAPDANICLDNVTRGDRAPAPSAASIPPGSAMLSSYLLAPRPAVTPIAVRSPEIIASSGGSRLSILFCSFQT